MLQALAATTVASFVDPSLFAQDTSLGKPLAPWNEGELLLHHIDTGRGNCTLIVGPDGTTIMIDAGAANAAPETSSALRPNGTRRPGQWQARYAARWLPHRKLDYFVATHVHPDHIGDITPQSPLSPQGNYRLTGVTDVAATIPITTLIDRDFPNNQAPPAPSSFADNYRAYLLYRQTQKQNTVAANVDSEQQIRLRYIDQAAPLAKLFTIRILAANGQYWNRSKPQDDSLPVLVNVGLPDVPENGRSIALRLRYGNFRYYTGGDLNADTHDGLLPELDRETPVARACGPVDVATANHHGYFDSCGPAFVQSLQARVYILQTWDIGHPGVAQMERLTASWTGHTADVFATGLAPANRLLNRRFVPMLKSTQGHVVVRVASGGATYRIFVLDSSHEDAPVLAGFGPYTSRPGAA